MKDQKNDTLKVGELFSQIANRYKELYELYARLAEIYTSHVTGSDDASESNHDYAQQSDAVNGEKVKAFLNRKGIEIINHLDVYREYGELIHIANFIAERYEDVKDFIEGFKRTQVTGENFFIRVENASASKISNIAQLGQLAQEAGLLARFRYQKSQKTFTIQPNRSSYSINFLTGKWLELYVWNALNKKVLPYFLAKDPEMDNLFSVQILFPNGTTFEIDAFLLVKGLPIWIESKTGEFSDKIPRFAEIRKLLGVKPENAFLLSTQKLSENSRKAREKAAGMKILYLSELEDALKTRLTAIIENRGLNGGAA